MKKILLSCFILFLLVASASSQSVYFSDALRYSLPGEGIGARSLGMGMAYTGIATDYSAAYWNPAGLGQIKRNEVSMGLSSYSYGNDATFLGNTTSYNNSTTDLNSLGLVYSIPTTQGSFVLAFGYGRSNDFTTALSFKGNNPNSSMADYIGADFVNALYLGPVHDSVGQKGKVLEGGGINNWMASGAIEASQNLFLGATLDFISGSYTYNRTYTETDAYGKYYDYALNNWNIVDADQADITGFTARFGLLYKFGERSRVGFNIKLPTYYTVKQNFSSDAVSHFDTPDSAGVYDYSYGTYGNDQYDLRTPFVFSAGFSVGADDLILASDVEYTDWTQMEFTGTNGDTTLDNANMDFKQYLTQTFNFHVGAEYHIPMSSLRLRGGFAYLPSPYKGDPTSYDRKYITGGVGILIADALMIDIGYAHGFWETVDANYKDSNGNSSSQSAEKITTNNVTATLSYRF